jgi:HAD superfamily hydrolase (TIGR01549 family)
LIKAIVFDLDGTLVRTEDLKALSYARAVVTFKPDVLTVAAVIESFKNVVGLPRQEVSEWLVKRFDLEEVARARMQHYGIRTPWESLAAERLGIYENLLETPEIFDQFRCPYNVGLLEYVKREGFKVALATMSQRAQARRILELLGKQDSFDVIACREDVAAGKPDPEIYFLVARKLGVQTSESLVVEDSVNGIKAALAAGMPCIAVTTNLTREAVHKSNLIERQWIVDDPSLLMTITRQMIADNLPIDVMPRQRVQDTSLRKG